LVNIIACNVKAQTSDYIVKDSAQIFGKISLVKDKVQIQRSRADNPILYSAGEVSVFSLSGDIYKSLPYKGERYFFKEIADDITLKIGVLKKAKFKLGELFYFLCICNKKSRTKIAFKKFLYDRATTKIKNSFDIIKLYKRI